MQFRVPKSEALVLKQVHLQSIVLVVNISYTVFFRNFTGFLPNIQVFFRTRRFPLDCPMSYPIRSCVLWNGTYPILKTFLQYLRYRRFEGVEAPGTRTRAASGRHVQQSNRGRTDRRRMGKLAKNRDEPIRQAWAVRNGGDGGR